MKVAVFSTKTYDETFLNLANVGGKHSMTFFEPQLDIRTSRLGEKFPCVCTFVNDRLDADVLQHLFDFGTKLVALRCAGFNNVDLKKAKEIGMTLARVPAYSPGSIAEHAIGLILCLSRKIHKAYNRTREGNFSLNGLLGSDLTGKTVGTIGTGRIGALTAKILMGFGCDILAYDKYENEELKSLGAKYVEQEELFKRSDVISLHCPLFPETFHMINEKTISMMKRGVMIINTSRGALLDTEAAIDGLKSGKIGALGLDVYEEEEHFFFEDYSDKVIQDDVFARILTFPNVIITGHQAFFTAEAMQAIAEQTIANITAFEAGETPPGLIST